MHIYFPYYGELQRNQNKKARVMTNQDIVVSRRCEMLDSRGKERFLGERFILSGFRIGERGTRRW
jgi:hypothetical protein